jgi:hypothetical protein
MSELDDVDIHFVNGKGKLDGKRILLKSLPSYNDDAKWKQLADFLELEYMETLSLQAYVRDVRDKVPSQTSNPVTTTQNSSEAIPGFNLFPRHGRHGVAGNVTLAEVGAEPLLKGKAEKGFVKQTPLGKAINKDFKPVVAKPEKTFSAIIILNNNTKVSNISKTELKQYSALTVTASLNKNAAKGYTTSRWAAMIESKHIVEKDFNLKGIPLHSYIKN